MKQNKVDTSWDNVAGWYDSLVGERGTDFHQTIVMPGALRLLELKAGEKVLDIGCGQGVFCRQLYAQKVTVTGIDASFQLIQTAKQRSPKEIRFEVLKAEKVAQANLGILDAAVCLLAIQNMEPLEAILKGCADVLRNGGRLVIVMTHPAFRIPRQSGWGWDEQRKLQYRRVDRYLSPLKIPIQMHPGSDPGQVTWSFHRSLETYVKSLTASGFAITALEEWVSNKESQRGGRSNAENTARKEIPMFLALRAEKVN